jgi:hypothetical protein
MSSSHSLQDVRSHFVGQLASIEISTAIVSEIIKDSFIPWEVYRNIYQISSVFLVNSAINPQLHPRYLQLRRQLELEYHLLLLNPDFPFYSRHHTAEIIKNLEILESNNFNWENFSSKLPSPISTDRQNNRIMQKLLNNRDFLSILRRLNELTTDLEQQQRSIPTETIFARTAIHLDGKISHCYCQEIFHHPDKAMILKLHDRAIANAEKRWRESIEFIIDLVS